MPSYSTPCMTARFMENDQFQIMEVYQAAVMDNTGPTAPIAGGRIEDFDEKS